MKSLYLFAILLILLSVMMLSFIPVSAPVAAPATGLSIASDITISPEVIRGPDLVIWEGPPHEGPSIQVLPTDRLSVAAIDTTGLVFDVDWAGSWPTEAQTAFNYALNLWSARLQDTGFTVTISATWESFGNPNILGTGGPSLGACSSGCPFNETWYPTALFDKIVNEDVMGTGFDIYTTLNSDKEDDFYYGLDGNPKGKLDFVTIVMHEIGHGLGLIGGMWVDSASCLLPGNTCDCGGPGRGCLRNSYGYPIIYDWFTEDLNEVSLLNDAFYPQDSIELGNALQSNSLYFDGTLANAGNGGERVPIYAPSIWVPGSSYSHLDYETYYGYENSLMTFQLTSGDAFHDSGPVTLGIFEDIGWGMLPQQSVYIPLVIK